MEILIINFLCLLIFGGAFITWTSSWWGLIFLILGIILLFKSFKKIPSRPPNIGLVTIWGERKKWTKKEGWNLIAPYFPFIYDVTLIEVTKKNEDFIFEKVRCVISKNVKTDEEEVKEGKEISTNIRSGGSVKVVVSITWIPDKAKLIAYTESGGEGGVRRIISDKMAEVIRQMGRNHTWEQMTFATDVMSANLIISIVGLDNIKEQMENADDWTWGDEIDHLKIKKGDLKKAFKFLQQALINGVGDSHDLGIKIRRLNIKQVEPEGELQKDAEKSAIEVQQRRAEVFELATEIELAQSLQKSYNVANTPKTLEECILEVRRRKTIREGHGKIIDIAGISPELIASASRLLGR